MKEITGQFIRGEGLDIVTTFIALCCISGVFYENNPLMSGMDFGTMLIIKFYAMVMGIHILQMNEFGKKLEAFMLILLGTFVFWNIGMLYLEIIARII